MTDFEITGADDFYRLSKALKAAGRTDLRRQLHQAMRKVTRPLIAETQRALAGAVPGRLAGRAAQTKQVVKVKTGRDPGVTIAVPYGRRGTGLGASNAQLANRSGQIRHPVYGNRKAWANTSVPAATGWFDQTLTDGAPAVRSALEAVLEGIAQDIVKDARH